MSRLASVLLPALALSAGACFATRDDVRLLQSDIATLRTERAQADSAHQTQLAQVIQTLGGIGDSLRTFNARLAKMQGDVRGDLYAMGQQLIAVQELTGQSQRRLQELRSDLEQRTQAPAAAPIAASAATSVPDTGARAVPSPPTTTAAAPAVTPGAPGPNQLFQLSLDQLRRGSYATARSGFQELVRLYPTADVAADAQFYIGEAYRAEGNAAAADSAYQLVVSRFPTSPRVPTALYKRAQAFEAKGNLTAARAALNEIIQKFPRSDEAALARERLRTIR
ncbi:MAG: tol-pal system protein YbgF [Gemmatimonadaceae bacterium]